METADGPNAAVVVSGWVVKFKTTDSDSDSDSESAALQFTQKYFACCTSRALQLFRWVGVS